MQKLLFYSTAGSEEQYTDYLGALEWGCFGGLLALEIV